MRSILRRPAALLLAMLLVPVAAWATSYIFAEAKCKLWLPEKGWNRNAEREKASPAILAAIENDDASKVVVVMATTLPVDGNVKEPGFVDGIMEGLKRHATITRSGYTKLGGIPAYEFVGTEMSGGSSYLICTAANSRLYMISARAKSGSAELDKDVRSIVESFAFIGAPQVKETAKGE